MNATKRRLIVWSSLMLVIACWAPTTFAQEQEEPVAPRVDANQDDEQMDRASPEMREMARAMKSMADMCQMMMQKEMALRPYWITAIISVGTLLVIALVLFIVLEVQWIRFWNLRIKTERKNLSQQ